MRQPLKYATIGQNVEAELWQKRSFYTWKTMQTIGC